MQRRPIFERLESRDLLTAVFVTTEDDFGEGSFRKAIELANLIPDVDRILFRDHVEQIKVMSPIQFVGTQELTINGLGASISMDDRLEPNSIDLFHSTGGGSLQLRNLEFNGGDRAIHVSVPYFQTEEISVVAANVSVLNSRHGIEIDDSMRHPIENRFGSDAGVFVRVHQGLLSENQTNGLTLNKRGQGGADIRIAQSELKSNGSDGFELTSAGTGNLRVVIRSSDISGNSSSGGVIKEFGSADLILHAIDTVFTENAIDREDYGLSVVESGEGNLNARLLRSHFEGNGNPSTSFRGGEDDAAGLNLQERNEGNLILKATASSFNSHKRGPGIAFEESFSGEARIYLERVDFFANIMGISGEEEDAGRVIFRANEINIRNFTYYGIEINEAGAAPNQERSHYSLNSIQSINRRTIGSRGHVSIRSENLGFKIDDVEVTGFNDSTRTGIEISASLPIEGEISDTKIAGNEYGILVSQSEDDPRGTVTVENSQFTDNSIEDEIWTNIDLILR